VLPLVVATGSGAVSRQIFGTTVLGGMIAATFIAIFIIPTTFYVSQRFSRRAAAPAAPPAPATPLAEGPPGSAPAGGTPS
jgi:HAE1 family hydrophobic/amphiphilic exporter-1